MSSKGLHAGCRGSSPGRGRFLSLREGNSKPFYRHLRGQRPKQHISLLNTDGDITDDPAVCSTSLNTHFHDHFNKTHALHGQDPASNKPNCGEIEVYGVIKLLNHRQQVTDS
jgi:hypothetical protein